jgi:hypothetical protein
MKTKIKLGMAIVLIAIGMAACDKADEQPGNSIEGTYVGTLTNQNLKGVTGEAPGNTSATADVTIKGDTQIEVHCYSDKLDTTFMLNYYHDHDSVMICLTGEAFEQEYGHMGQGHHMGDMGMHQTEWEHHMADDHDSGDRHYGGFDMANHTFGYSFLMLDGETQYMVNFQGTKN